MKKILYYDCFAGISGDMNLAAMIDLGISPDYLRGELAKLNLHEFELKVTKDSRNSIGGTRVDVIVHEHHHGHHHGDKHEEKHHHHRNVRIISEIIDNSHLSQRVKDISKDIFMHVARAEAKIHQKSPEEIHFHEVGATDSIVDIVGAAICYDHLEIDKVLCSPVQLGGGFVTCAHGTMPVPAPATAEILKDVPVRSGAVQFETTTPTGAAILKTLVNEFTDKPEFRIQKTAYGIGHKESEFPNLLRAYIGTLQEDLDTEKQGAVVIESNIDDMIPEHYDFLMQKLFQAGAHDVYFTPIIMKKNRPAVKVSVLCAEGDEPKFINILLSESSTFGIRKTKVTKEMLVRKTGQIETRFGKVRIKYGYLNGALVKSKPEYDDIRRLAEKNNLPVNDVYLDVLSNLNQSK